MKLFIWNDANPAVSTDYHSDGGLVIAAADLTSAQIAWDAYYESEIKDEYPDGNRPLGEPDFTYDLAPDSEPRVITFPDAGCC